MPFFLKVILVLLLILILEIYFFKKLFKTIIYFTPNVSKKKINTVKWIVITLVNLYPVIAILAWINVAFTKSGYFAPPENFLFDYFILYPFWFGALVIIQTTLFILILELLSLLTIPFLEKGKRKRVKSVLFLMLFIASFLYVPSRIIYDYNNVEISEVVYRKTELPKSLDNFKITFVSDIQADRYTDEKRLNRFIDMVNSTKPDLVLMAGDMITSTPKYIQFSADQLSKIQSKHGVFTCVGDHDNWAYRGDNERSLSEITKALSKVNIPMIDNNRLVLGIDSAVIEITFVTNTYVEKISSKELDSLTKNVNNADLRIFLTHQPRKYLINKAKVKNYDMYLCGHTHGGQITFLFPFYNLSPTMIETPYMRGEFWFDNMLMIVTRGLGMSLAPVRYNSTPEVTTIIIKAE